MKKFLLFNLSLILLLSFEYKAEDNIFKSETLSSFNDNYEYSTVLKGSHKITPISKINISKSSTDFSKIETSMKSTSASGKTVDLVDITVENNTKDGWSLTLTSMNGNSSLKSINGNSHGETDIVYTLLCEVNESESSSEAKSFLNNLNINNLDFNSNGELYLMDIQSQNRATKPMTFSLKINIVTNGEIAGNYTETITYSYTDY